MKDAYKSLYEALAHGGIANEAAVEVVWVDAERIEREGLAGHVAGLDGILVPGGFGDRGIEGKIQAIRYAREQQVPYFGICLGMQCAVIEYARHVCGLAGANSTEFDPTPRHNVIDLLPEQRHIGTRAARCASASTRSSCTRAARPRARTGRASSGSGIATATRSTTTTSPDLEKNGLCISGIWAEKQLVEIIELPDHPVVRRGPVPSRVPVAPVGAAPALRRVREGRARAARGTA